MLDSSQTFKRQSQSFCIKAFGIKSLRPTTKSFQGTEMTVKWEDFPIKITEMTEGNQENGNSVIPQTKENLVSSPKDEGKKGQGTIRSCRQL